MDDSKMDDMDKHLKNLFNAEQSKNKAVVNAGARATVGIIKSHYDAALAEGFSRAEALSLALGVWKTMLGMFKDHQQPPAAPGEG